jgi:calcineurin-like phosphoesterase family protein
MSGKTFVTSDLHFGHKNIIVYENRPFLTVEEMDQKLIQNWNNVVSKTDKVFVLGDVSFYDKEKTKELVTQLNGKKILICGNHDKGRNVQWWLDVGFQEVSKFPIIINEFIVLSHEPPTYFNSCTPYFYLYGHVHGSDMYKTVTKNTACVCCERWGYTPVNLEKIKDLATLVD